MFFILAVNKDVFWMEINIILSKIKLFDFFFFKKYTHYKIFKTLFCYGGVEYLPKRLRFFIHFITVHVTIEPLRHIRILVR